MTLYHKDFSRWVGGPVKMHVSCLRWSVKKYVRLVPVTRIGVPVNTCFRRGCHDVMMYLVCVRGSVKTYVRWVGESVKTYIRWVEVTVILTS